MLPVFLKRVKNIKLRNLLAVISRNHWSLPITRGLVRHKVSFLLRLVWSLKNKYDAHRKLYYYANDLLSHWTSLYLTELLRLHPQAEADESLVVVIVQNFIRHPAGKKGKKLCKEHKWNNYDAHYHFLKDLSLHLCSRSPCQLIPKTGLTAPLEQNSSFCF